MLCTTKMNFLDKLSSFVKVVLPKVKNVEIIKNLRIGSTENKISIQNNFFIADPEKFNKEGVKALKGLVKDSIKDGYLVLKDDSKKLLEDFKKVDSRKQNRELLEYFSGKIPSGDLEALRASLFIKDLHEKGIDRDLIHKLKQDIIFKHGRRGGYIANLTTAGYFESIIKPLYEEMATKPDFKMDTFRASYDQIVIQQPFAVFVSRVMTEEDLEKEVTDKIETNKKYGIQKLKIHAIGKSNVDKITNIINKLKDDFTRNPDVESGQDYLTMTIWF